MDQNFDKNTLLKLLQGYAAFTGVELDQMSFLLQKIDEYQIPLEDFLNNCSSSRESSIFKQFLPMSYDYYLSCLRYFAIKKLNRAFLAYTSFKEEALPSPIEAAMTKKTSCSDTVYLHMTELFKFEPSLLKIIEDLVRR